MFAAIYKEEEGLRSVLDEQKNACVDSLRKWLSGIAEEPELSSRLAHYHPLEWSKLVRYMHLYSDDIIDEIQAPDGWKMVWDSRCNRFVLCSEKCVQPNRKNVKAVMNFLDSDEHASFRDKTFIKLPIHLNSAERRELLSSISQKMREKGILRNYHVNFDGGNLYIDT